ncbi:MAG: dTDP-4-dehydrorhamnose reductase [Chlorobi bacterium]|nr:dTDP-4-dehydrorhamnose reductase [Chlorobiota bacterium]
MNILTTGANGQLGMSIRKNAPSYPGHRFTFTDFEELDITDFEKVKEFLSVNKFDVLINCAAYTAVDKAEEEKEKAQMLNVTAARDLARLTKMFNVFLIHISTDFIFDGKKKHAYTEEDQPNPLSVYGKTKADGENTIIDNAGNAAIIRTSWLYSEYGDNFLKTIIRLASERESLNIVDDQTGTPTYATDLAKFILDVMPNMTQAKGVGTYHYSNEGETSWYGFAKAIVKIKGISCAIYPIPTREYPLPATRPAFSVMSKEKIKSEFGVTIPTWENSLRECIAGL